MQVPKNGMRMGVLEKSSKGNTNPFTVMVEGKGYETHWTRWYSPSPWVGASKNLAEELPSAAAEAAWPRASHTPAQVSAAVNRPAGSEAEEEGA